MAEEKKTTAVTATWGDEAFTPVPFNSFRVGPFSLTTAVRPDETPEQAMDRAYTFLDNFARKVYVQKRKGFFDRYEGRT
jgi:hypothetical protein